MKKLIAGMAFAVMITAACNRQENMKSASDNQQIAIENIMTRSSVRQYTDQAVSEATVDTLLRAGMAAPTAANKQPWSFVVVTEQALKDSLITVLKYGRPIEKAPVSIVVCGDMTKTLEGDGRDYWIQDCSAATENILLAAHAVGLGAVWCGVYPQTDRVEGVSKILNLPDHLVPLNVIAVGYPGAPANVKDKWNPDNVHFNAY